MLSFLAGRNNENSTLMIMNVDGTERRQVVTIEAVGGPGSLISDVDFTPDSEKTGSFGVERSGIHGNHGSICHRHRRGESRSTDTYGSGPELLCD